MRKAVFLAVALFAVTTISAQETTMFTNGGGDWTNPSVDLRGKLLAYRSGGTLYLHDIRLGTVAAIATSVNDSHVSATGRFVAFASDSNPLGQNGDGNSEIFLYDVKNQTTVQITVTSDSFDCSEPSVDKRGRYVAFMSDANITGNNGDASEEVFLYSVLDQAFTQVTASNDSFSISNPIMDSKGKYVYFDADANLTGQNADGNNEIFRYEIESATLEQLTLTTNGDSERPMPNKNSRFVVFQTDSTQILGVNTDGNDEIARLDLKKDLYLRLTNYAFTSSRPSVSGNGKYVTFESSGDPLATNGDGSQEVFLVQIRRSGLVLTQATDGQDPFVSRRACLDNAGKRVFFQSDANLTGQGSGSDHIFRFAR